MRNRDGPKFGERRTSAEEFGRTFGSATCELFGRTSAELQQKFGVTFCGSALAVFCVNLKSLYFIVTIVYLLLVTS